jgi:hypothetical protein
MPKKELSINKKPEWAFSREGSKRLKKDFPGKFQVEVMCT